jgi:hypothetical protein
VGRPFGVMLSLEQVDELTENLGFNHWPRAIGNPRQHFIYASEQAFKSYRDWWGESSCFISTAGYDNLAFDNGKQSPHSIIYGLTFFDFDHETKPENSFADAQRLSQYLTEIDVAHWVQYSGSKGYHVFIVHKPHRFRFEHRDGSAEALKTLVNQTQTHLKKSLGLNTLDEQTTGDPKRLCRFPFTPHINRHGDKSGRHAMPVSAEQLNTMSHNDIEGLSYRPRYHMPEVKGQRLSLPELIQLLDVKLHKPETEIRPVISSDFGFTDAGGETQAFVASLENRCMGVVNELKRRNPSHSSRVYSALYAKTMQMDMMDFEQVWVELGTQMGYVDLHNTEHRQYQMRTLFDDPRFVSFPNCSTLKAKGCCVGAVCPRFVDMGDAPPKRIIKRKWNKK